MNLSSKNRGLWLAAGLVLLTLSVGTAEEDAITVNFADSDVRYVLDTLAKQRGLSIVLSDKIQGNINIRFEDVPFWDAFEAILEVKGFGHEMVGKIIKIATLEELEGQRKEREKVINNMKVEIFRLKYVNAKELEKVVKEFLSSKGSATVYYSTVRGGWLVAGISKGETEIGVAPRVENKGEEFPRTLIVRDFPENLRRIGGLLEELDKAPKQVLIEALIVEMGYDRARDIGIDWESLGQAGAEGNSSFVVGKGREIAADIKGGDVSPLTKGFTGLTLSYRHLTGAKFEAAIHALEQEDKANVLSRPRMLVLNGHEGTILIGSKYPIFSTSVTEQGITTEELDRYEPIGVTLKVIPVIWEGSRINMAVHPIVSALGDDVTGTTGLTVKEIVTREVDTNITIRSGDTVVIGGLIKSEDKITQYRVPFLGRIPILGWFFRRENKVVEKTELLIFITPSIMEEVALTESEGAKFKESQETLEANKIKSQNAK